MSKIRRGTTVLTGKPDFIFKAEDTGERCSITIPRPENDDEAEKLFQAIAMLIVGAAETLSKTGSTCGHVACNFNTILRAAISEMREAHPKEFEQARIQMEGLQKALLEGRKDDEPLH